MYGTIARMRVKDENRQKLESIMRDWDRELRPNVEGARSSYLFWPDDNPGTAFLIAIFDDEASYRKNAANPQQDAWFQRLRGLIEEDPHWMDGSFTSATEHASVGANR